MSSTRTPGDAPRADAPSPSLEIADRRLVADGEPPERQARFLEVTLSHVGDYVYVWDRDRRFVYANKPLVRLWGVTGDGYVGKRLADLGYTPEACELLEAQVDRVVATGASAKGLMPYTSPTGVKGFYEYVFNPIADGGGSVAYVAGVSRDVSEQKRLEALQTAQNRALEAVAGPAPLEEALAVLAKLGEEQAPAGSASSIMLVDGDGLRLRSCVAPSLPRSYLDAVDGVAIGEGVGTCADAVARNAVVFTPCIATSPSWAGMADLALGLGFTAAWSMPICGGDGRVLGAFGTYLRESREPTAWERQVVEGLCRAAALAIERRWSETALRESEERYAVEAAAMSDLHESARRLLHAPDEAAALHELLDAVIRVQGAAMGNVQVLDPATRTLDIFAQRGFDPELLEPYLSLDASDDETVCGRAFLAGERLVIEDVMTDEAYAPHRGLAAAAGFRGVQSTPLIGRDGVLLGIVSTHFREPHVPSEEALRLTDLHVGYAAEVIARMRAAAGLRQTRDELERRVVERTAELQRQASRLRDLAGRLASAEQRERKRLAAILHDDLQQYLVAAKMRLQATRKQVAETPAARSLDDSVGMIDRAIESSRDLTRQLRPPVLYEDGLVPALRWLGKEMAERHRLNVELDAPDAEPPLDDDTKAMLFESVRELLFNVVKHAGVDAARVRVLPRGGSLRIEVGDDGAGLPPGAMEKKKDVGATGIGLFSVGERLAALGGTMAVESDPGAGTTITLDVPLTPGDRPAGAASAAAPAATGAERRRGGRPSRGRPPRVLLVDDHTIVRQGIATLLRDDGRVVVVGEAADGVEALEQIEAARPDVVLMDVNMPRMNGLEATREVRRRWPGVHVVGLSVQDDDASIRSLRGAGAAGFVSKSDSAERILDAILAACADCDR